ncbi:MAG TPA: adenylate/guanylate cyclase domain-containing protein [Burkholderiales bacterium]|nr:adenylate/guanylate cyclase domain-containing protein [Burkholderiales bacterium]
MDLTALQRGRVKLYLRILAISAPIGAVYGVVLTPAGALPLLSMVIGIGNSMVVAGSIAAIEIFLLREGSSAKRLLRLPFVAVVVLKSLAYAAIVTAVTKWGTAQAWALLFPGSFALAPLAPLDPRGELTTIGVSLATTLIFVIVLQAAGLVGRRTFRDLVLGRYRRPRRERRFFLFVDVIGSTAIAERLGPMQAHQFLAAVFSATAEPVAACNGEIYQYVGDEIVVTWTEKEGRLDARPLRCFFLMEAALLALEEQFRERFAAEPGLRAALHLGEVIAGEVGEQRRAIVFHGDVMNTASRLEQATRDQGVRFIASAAALDSLGPQADMEMKDLGELALRGRKQPIRASGVELRR